MLRFPVSGNNPKNKFGQVLAFVMRDFPSYFFVRPKIRKIIIFPFMIVYMIVRKTKDERFGFWMQLLFILMIGLTGFAGYQYYNNPQLFVGPSSIFTREYYQPHINKLCKKHFAQCGSIEKAFGREFFDQKAYRQQKTDDYKRNKKNTELGE